MRMFFSHPFIKSNKGDVAILKATLSSLSKEIPDAKISFYCIEHSRIKSIWSELVVSLKDYVKTDIVVFATRDDLSLTYGPLLFFSIIYGFFITILLGKPFFLYASQIGPFGSNLKGRIASAIVSSLLNKASLITVRDSISERYLIKMGVSRPPVFVTADPAFLLRPSPSEKIRRLLSEERVNIHREIVGLTPSSLIYTYGFSEISTLKEKRSMYVDLMSRTIDHITQNLGVEVILIPHVFMPGNCDNAICREIRQKATNKDKIKLIKVEALEPEEIKGIIGLCSMFITSRYHPLIHSTSMLVPTIAIDYTFKMKDLMDELGCSNWRCHIEDVNFKELIFKIDQLWTIRKEVRKNLVVRIKDIKKRSEFNIELIKDFISCLSHH